MDAAPSRSDWDVIVVGAGTAGMPAAVFAANRGARVLVLESAERVGGTLWVSSGQMSAAGTRLQKAKGIDDSADEHFEDVMRISRGTANPDIVRLAVDHAAATFDWLCDLGIALEPDHPITGWAHEHYGRPRYYWGPEGGRSIKAAILPEFERLCADGRIDLRLRHEATGLEASGNRVTGVAARGPDGSVRSFNGRNVILASGGYAADPVMYEQLSNAPLYAASAYPYSRGTGHRLALSLGGTIRGAEHFHVGFGVVLDGDEYPAAVAARLNTYPERRQPWEVYVNERGQRFVREDLPSVDAREKALFAQPGRRFWAIFDAAILEAAPPLVSGWSREETLRAFERKHPSFARGDTLRELAENAGIDADGLEATIRGYNYGVGTGLDFFGRQHCPAPVARAPFFGIRLQGTAVTSAAGVAVNRRLQVVREDGTEISNLFAAGEILGSSQTMGNAACGGMMVTPALTFGRLLGQSIVPAGS